MPHLLSRALVCFRAPSLCHQFARLPLATQAVSQTASISIKANPLEPEPTPKNAASKIPPSKRPLSRGPIPPPTLSPESLENMPYIVRRTAFAQMPVYRKWKSGGTRQVVTVKRISGDRSSLVEELASKLTIPRKDIRLNPTTGNLELQGDYFDITRNYLLERGF